MPLTEGGLAVRRLVSMTAGPSREFHSLTFRPVRPSASLRGGSGLGVPDEILGLAGRNRAIGTATGRQISSGTPNRDIGGPIGAPTGDTLTELCDLQLCSPWDLCPLFVGTST